jgi:hypothetical protein
MMLRPVLQAVYARERETGDAEVEEALADVTPEDLAPLTAGGAMTMEELARAQVLAAVVALLEDAVCTLRRKSRALAEAERAIPTKTPTADAPETLEEATPAEPEPKPSPHPWRDREVSWRARAVLDAMALPRETTKVPDELYWAAALVEASETAVPLAPSRLVAAATLRRLADHERSLDAALAAMTAARKGKGKGRGKAKDPVTAELLAPPALDNPSLSYCPPDPRRLDPEVLAIARKVLARGASDLAQGKVDAAVVMSLPPAGAATAAITAASPFGRMYEPGPEGPAPLPPSIRDLVIPPRPQPPPEQQQPPAQGPGTALSPPAPPAGGTREPLPSPTGEDEAQPQQQPAGSAAQETLRSEAGQPAPSGPPDLAGAPGQTPSLRSGSLATPSLRSASLQEGTRSSERSEGAQDVPPPSAAATAGFAPAALASPPAAVPSREEAEVMDLARDIL